MTLQSLKESVDECDMGVQYHLSRYVYLYEGVLASDGVTVSPINNAQDGASSTPPPLSLSS